MNKNKEKALMALLDELHGLCHMDMGSGQSWKRSEQIIKEMRSLTVPPEAPAVDVEALKETIKATVNDPVIKLGIGIAIEHLAASGQLRTPAPQVGLAELERARKVMTPSEENHFKHWATFTTRMKKTEYQTIRALLENAIAAQKGGA